MPAKRTLITFMLFLVTISAVHAQTISAPAILYFKADADSVHYVDVEAGTAAVNMSWNVVGLTPDYYLQMHAWVNEQWGLVGEKFDAKKSDRIVIAHPRDFGLPTYRLSVVNKQGVIVASTFLQLHYLAPDPDERPRINEFSTAVTSLNTNQLSDGKVFIPIHWAIDKRWAEINPVFEQLLPDGQVVSVERPRTNLWVPASGDGVITPHTGDGQSVMLQMRLVDVQTDQTLDTRQVTLPVSVTAPLTTAVPDTSTGHAYPLVSPPIVLTTMPPTTQPTPATYDSNTPGFFFLSDIYDLTQSHTITLSWNAPNASQVWIEMHELGTSGCNKIYHIPAQVYGPLSASGSLPVTIPDTFAIGAWFEIYVDQYGTAQCDFHGVSAASVTVMVPQPTSTPPPATFTANATSQSDDSYESVPGDWVTLSWIIDGDQPVYITGADDFDQKGPLPAIGSLDVCPRSGGTTYTLHAGGEPGNAPGTTLTIYVPSSLEYPAYQAGSNACWNQAEATPS